MEAREHIRRFHELFFSIAPDKDAIEENMSRAFALCDKSALLFKDLAERGLLQQGDLGQLSISVLCRLDPLQL